MKAQLITLAMILSLAVSGRNIMFNGKILKGQTIGEGRIEVVNGRLRMDAVVNDRAYALNEAVLQLDMTGMKSVTLQFDHWSLHDEYHPLPASFEEHANGDGVAISPDGKKWYTVTSLKKDFTAGTFDLDEVAKKNGLTLEEMYTAGFCIKFQQYDNYPAPADGREIDNIVLKAIAPRKVPDEKKVE